MATKRTAKASSRASSADADIRLLKALSHPTRARALSILNEEVASPKMIAEQLGLPVGTVGHHIKQLEALKCIELVKTEPRRGATEHFYRGTVRSVLDLEQWAKLRSDSKLGLSIEWVKLLNQAMREALVAKTFNSRDDRHLSRTPVTVDEQGWQELMKLLEQTLKEAQAIEVRSASRERNGEAVGEGFKATVALLGFESPAKPKSTEN